MKNILIISYSYPPNNVAGAQRPYALAKYLDKDLYNIKVITCENPDLPLGENKSFNPNIEGVEIIKIKSKISGNVSGNLRKGASDKNNSLSIRLKSSIFKIGQKLIFPDKGMFWYANVKSFLNNNKQLLDSIDVVYSTSPGITNHQIALFIKNQNNNINWIADFRDFNFVENWENKKEIRAFLHKILETKIVKNANSLTFVTNTMLKSYKEFYPHFSDKMKCIYNGFDTNDFQNINYSNNIDKIIFFYAGTFYGNVRSPFPLLQLIDLAVEENLLSKDKFSIQIAGNIDDNTKTEMGKYQCFESIEFLGNLPRNEVIKRMSAATFLWLIVGNIKSHYQTIPIKLFEYIASRRPILNFAPNESECSQIILDQNLGVNINTLNFDKEASYIKFKELLKNYKNGIYKDALPIGNLDFFTWQKQIQKFKNLF